MNRRSCRAVVAVACLLALASRVSAQACMDWRQILPAPRWGAAMAYDSHRDVLVLFGGDIGERSSETWECHASVWSLRTNVGPAPRRDHAMSFDSERGVIVMFGGTNEAGGLRDTWEWDGTDWTLRSMTGPSVAAAHAMAYDPLRRVTLMCGGGAGNGTWEWNGQRWFLRAVGAPANRSNHSMFFDEQRGAVILFGGAQPQVVLGDTWQWDHGAGKWTLLNSEGPARFRHAAAYDPVRRAGVVHGGSNTVTQSLEDTWLWDSSSELWQLLDDAATNPSGHDAVMAYGAGAIHLFGGRTVGADLLGDYWTLAPQPRSAWIRVMQQPVFWWQPTMAYDARRNVVVAFVSRAQSDVAGQTWEWDGEAWTLRSVSGPSPRAACSMVYDSIRGVCVLFGGATNYSFPLGDTWEWDGQAWALVANTGPVSRWSHGMAFDESRGVTVLFGGTHDNSANLADTWEWNGQAWTQRQVPGPFARRDCRMTFDSSRGLVVLFGGGFNRDTWEWNGQLWQLRLAFEPDPPPSGASVFVYDTRRRKSVLLGQYPGFGVSSSSWWEWDGNEWSEQSTATGLWGDGNAMAYDIHRDVMVLLRSTTSARVQTIEYSLSPGCPLDLNEDGLIDIDDLLLLIGAWGPCPDGDCPEDLTHDGVVNIDDLLILLGGWE